MGNTPVLICLAFLLCKQPAEHDCLVFTCSHFNALMQGAKAEMAKTWPCDKNGGPGMFGLIFEDCSDLNNAAAWIAAVVGLAVAIVGGGIAIPLLKRNYAKGLIT